MKHIITTLLLAIAISVSAQERTSALKDLSNVDPATGRTALDVSPRSLLVKPASSAILAYTSRNRFTGPQTLTADNQTITSDVLGTMKTVMPTVSGVSIWRVRDGALTMFNSTGNTCGVIDGSTVTHTAGFTGIAYVVIDNARYDQIKIGFTSSASLTSGFRRIYKGVNIGAFDASTGNAIKGLTSTLGSLLAGTLMQGLRNGDVVGVAIELTSNGFDVWLQGGVYDHFGATAGSASWVKVWENTDGQLAGDLAFGVESVNGGGPCTVLEFATTNHFVPDERGCKTVGIEPTLNNQHAGHAFYDSDGNLWTSWWSGAGIDGSEDGITHLRVRTNQGVWSDTSIVEGPGAPGSGDCGDSGTFFETPDGTVRMVIHRSLDNQTTYNIYTRTVSVSASGVITVGARVEIPTSYDYLLNYHHAVTISQGAHSGRIILPCNVLEAGAYRWLTLYSDDNGATWNESPLYPGGSPGTYANETAVVEEGPNRQLAAYVRVPASPNGTYTPSPRYISSDGVTWTLDGTVPIPANDSRFQAIRLENGLVAVLANDTFTNYERTSTRLYLLGSGGSLVGSIPVFPNGGSQNYPGIAARGDEISVIMPMGQAAINTSPAKTLVVSRTLHDWIESARVKTERAWTTAGLQDRENLEYYFTSVATGSAVSCSTGVGTGVTSLSLPAGVWYLEGNVNFNLASATATELIGYIVTSGVPTDGTEVQTHINTTTLTTKAGVTIPRKRIVLTATTTVYLGARSTHSAGTVTAYGSLTASRQ